VHGTEVVVGVGKGGRVVAYTKEHRPVRVTPEIFEFRQAILRWVEEHVPLTRRVLPLINFGDLKRASTAHTAEHRLYPYVLAVASGGVDMAARLYGPVSSGEYTHPLLFSNIFELQHHQEWPIRVADDYVHVAQEFVGYFYGKHVIAGQMTSLEASERGDIDPSVKLTDEDWVTPFELEDDCALCVRMTDEDVERRVAAFQWEIDKESQGRTSAQGGPKHTDFDETPEGRAEYHRRVKQHVAATGVWAPFPLIDLPHELKRTLCIKWNHVVRDWLASDPRYCYKDGYYYVVWTERLGGIDTTPTRSDSYGADLTQAWYSTAATAAALGAALFHVSQSANPDEPFDARDIWLE
jgi:hypothetical protein